jgi:isopropylmalate/homocitrate/citramalate synthase
MADVLPTSVAIREVGPRDGFQNEPERIPTDDKVRLIDALARTGLHMGILAGRSERERAEA